MDKDSITDLILSILKNSHTSDYIGEGVTQLEHVILAANEAKNNNEENDIIISALLHDIGHQLVKNPLEKMLDNDGNCLGIVSHENVGADFLKLHNFNDTVVSYVRNHVAIKRYLCYKDKNYFNNLSESSKQTLLQQNGIMTEEEAKCYENINKDYLENMIKVRKYDDLGKDKNKLIGLDIFSELEKYRDLIRLCINN